jgi:serine/threonine protein kinase
MHEKKGVAHLDIKLENLVLDSNYFLKIIDFAYCESKDTRMCISKGTERYFAPEVAQIHYRRQVWHP